MLTDLLGLFGFVLILVRAAILCCQTVAVGGIVFLLVVARTSQFGEERWRHRAIQLVGWSALALAFAQVAFVISNTLILTSSAGLSIGDALGANYVIAGVLAIAAGLTVFFLSRGRRDRTSPISLIPAGAMILSSVMTSHSAARVDDRYLLGAFTTIHYIA